MLYINLRRVMRLRGVEDHYKMLVELGFAPATARNFLGYGVRRITFEHLEQLCLALNCTPNDLLEWKPNDNQATAEAQALIKLKRNQEEDLQKLLGSMPMEQIEQAFGIIQELKNKES